MCGVCGCGTAGEAPHHHHAHGHSHSHAHDHAHGGADEGGVQAGGFSASRLLRIEQDIMSYNDGFARENRARLAHTGTFALNFVSSPGSGKTTLLCRAIADLRARYAIAVIEGDQQTANDAERIRATGAPAVQINTGTGCHLDAHMVGHALDDVPLAQGGMLFIENVGNLVCPAGFDLGEHHKVVLMSVTEGEDKPEKYPGMFAASDLLLLTKCDLLPYLDFDMRRARSAALRVNPRLAIIEVSARTGAGMEAFYAWMARHHAGAKVPA